MAKLVHSQEIRADYHNAVPLARYGLEEEIAASVGFLCSSDAAYITGQVLAVDGGFDAAGVGVPAFRASLAAGQP
jgi:meso-butanediol dehydrogenase / (S,S)-butanediol dehydrogenase / diacetyl reductase